MVTHTLVLAEQLDTSRLFGLYDTHLKAIETTLGVAITARGRQLLLDGPEAGVSAAREILERLARDQEHGSPADMESVRYLLSRWGGTGMPDVPALEVSGPVGRLAPRTVGQAHYLKAMADHDLVIAVGPAGTGKTYLAMAQAVSSLNRKEVQRIILTRPAVEAGERLGFLPGDLIEKINPYLRPLYDALYDMMPVDAARRLLERGDIEIAPLAFMRGRTLNDAFIILDEGQNTTSEQMMMFLTRFGEHARVVVTGDRTQIDLPTEGTSGLCEIETVLAQVPGVAFVHLGAEDVVRHPLVARIIEAYAAHGRKKS